jgi:hypothetical protein
MIELAFVSLWALDEAFAHWYCEARLFTCHNSKDGSEGPKEVEEVKDKSEEEQVKIIDKILRFT